MYLELQKRLTAHLRTLLEEKYGLQVEIHSARDSPELELGELATPIAFELARKLRKAPKVIAQEIVSALCKLDGFSSFQVAGAGYINARLDRANAVNGISSAKSDPSRHRHPCNG